MSELWSWLGWIVAAACWAERMWAARQAAGERRDLYDRLQTGAPAPRRPRVIRLPPLSEPPEEAAEEDDLTRPTITELEHLRDRVDAGLARLEQ